MSKIVSIDEVTYTHTSRTGTTVAKTYRKVLSVVPSCSYRRALKRMSGRGWIMKGNKRKGHPQWINLSGSTKANYNRKRRVLWIVETRLVKTELVSHE